MVRTRNSAAAVDDHADLTQPSAESQDSGDENGYGGRINAAGDSGCEGELQSIQNKVPAVNGNAHCSNTAVEVDFEHGKSASLGTETGQTGKARSPTCSLDGEEGKVDVGHEPRPNDGSPEYDHAEDHDEHAGGRHSPGKNSDMEHSMDGDVDPMKLPPHGTELFIGNIPHACTRDDIREHCEVVGPLYALHIPPSRIDSTQNPGYAFAMYKSRVDAARAIEELSGSTMAQGRDRRLTIKYGNKQRNKLYIANVPREFGRKALLEAFREAVVGVVDIDVTFGTREHDKPGDNRGFCFLEMYNQAAAELAMKILGDPDLVFGGEKRPAPLRVEWADSKPSTNDQADVKSIHVGQLQEDVTEEKLREAFESLAPISRVSLLDAKGGGEGKKRDYAFLHYDKRSVAISVLEACQADPPYIDGHQVSVSIAKPTGRQEDRVYRGAVRDRGSGYSRASFDRTGRPPARSYGSYGDRGDYGGTASYDDYPYAAKRTLPGARSGYERRGSSYRSSDYSAPRDQYVATDGYDRGYMRSSHSAAVRDRERERSAGRHSADVQRWDGTYEESYPAYEDTRSVQRRRSSYAVYEDRRSGAAPAPVMDEYEYRGPPRRSYSGRGGAVPATGGYGSSRGGGVYGPGGSSAATRGYGGSAGRAPPPSRYGSGSRYGPY